MTQRTAAQKEKELADNARLLRAWKKFHKEERETVLAGPHAVTLSELFRMVANLKHVQPAQLIGFVRSIDWSVIDYATRLVVVHEINDAITAYRTKRGLDPIADNLPSEPESPFRTIRAIVLAPSPHARVPTGAQPGLSNCKPDT
jgi:hypothetical protein